MSYAQPKDSQQAWAFPLGRKRRLFRHDCCRQTPFSFREKEASLPKRRSFKDTACAEAEQKTDIGVSLERTLKQVSELGYPVEKRYSIK